MNNGSLSLEALNKRISKLEAAQSKQTIHTPKTGMGSSRGINHNGVQTEHILNALDEYLTKILSTYEQEIDRLMKRVEDMEKEMAALNSGGRANPSSVFFIDQLTCEKLETNNHIAQLGINQLKGRLDIGSTREQPETK